MQKNYFYYIEEMSQLNDLEKILYELVMFQESKYFDVYKEEKETKPNLSDDQKIAKQFNIAIDKVPILKKAFISLTPGLKESLNSYYFDLKIATSFGLGIGSLIPSVLLFLEKLEINISYESSILLAAGVILGVIYTKQNEIKKAEKVLKRINLKIKNDRLKKTFAILEILIKKLSIPIDKFMEYVAYTIMAIPTANALVDFLKQHQFNPVSVKMALAGLGISLVIQIFRRMPKVFNKFAKYFKMRKKIK